MKPVFLDTVGLLALWNSDDQWHGDASEAFSMLSSQRSRLVTTSFVLLECGNAAARRTFRSDVVELWKLLEARGELIRPTEDDRLSGWIAYQRSDYAGAGIVDCISF